MKGLTLEANAYSRLWFETFLRTQSPEWTAREVAFVVRQSPQPASLLDIARKLVRDNGMAEPGEVGVQTQIQVGSIGPLPEHR